jgi:serine/threonine protein kinase
MEERAVGRSKVLGRGVAALTIFGATVASIQLIGQAGQRQVAGDVRAAVDARVKQLRELLAGHLAGLELKGGNAAANPRLVAALSGRVGQETLRDLFETESWWQPVREAFSHTFVAPPGESPVFISGKKELALDLSPLIARALQNRRSASAVLPAEGWPHATVAVPVALPNSALTPVLVLVTPLESALVGKMAEQTGGAVLVSDGGRPLLGAGSAAQTQELRLLLGREARGSVVESRGGTALAVAVLPVAAGLWFLGYVDAAPILARAAAGHAAIRIAVGVVGAVAFLLLLGWIWRGSRGQAATSKGPTPAADEGPGRYVLLSRLGGGGMAEVHLAVAVGERGFRRPCVVKRLRPELAANPTAVAQFTDEATLASSLVHANIVPIFDFAKVGNDYLLVEEYIVGRDLGRLVRRAVTAGKRLSPTVLRYVAVEACKALEYAHGKRDHEGLPMGIVHRDVSPENIMVTIRGEVQLLDFGVMKVGHGRGGRTEIGELKGNLTFMAPEQARGLEVDGRADVFALGSVLYFCAAGEPLYGQETGYDLLVKAASGPGPEERRKLAALPAPLDAVLARALAPRREDRFATAAAFAEALPVQGAAAAAEIGALLIELYGEELNQEQQQLAASSVSLKMASALTPSPIRPIRGDLGR